MPVDRSQAMAGCPVGLFSRADQGHFLKAPKALTEFGRSYLKTQRTLCYDDGTTQNANFTVAHANLDLARPPHGVALLDEYARPVLDDAARYEVTREWTSSTAGGCVLPDADRGVEEPGVGRCGGVDRIEAEQVAALPADCGQQRSEALRVRAGTDDRRAIPDRDEQVRRSC